MKILFLEATQDFGGANMSTIELAKRLSVNHEVKIVDFYGTCKRFIDALKLNNIQYSIIDERSDPFILSNGNPLKRIANVLRFIPHIININVRVKRIASAFNADHVVVNNRKCLSALLFLSKRHETVFFARGWFLPSQISFIEKLLLKHVVSKYICVSHPTRHALYAAGIKDLSKIYVVHNAIDNDVAATKVPRVQEETIRILHSGGFLPDKGQHVSVQIAKILRDQGAKFKMSLVGIIYSTKSSSDYHHSILREIKELNLEKYVEVIVNPKSPVTTYFGCNDILIHPSNTEGLPRVIMEAMINKVLVLANPVGGVGDYVLHLFTGILPCHSDPADFARWIVELSSNNVRRDAMIENAYQLVCSTFTAEEQVRQYENVFETARLQNSRKVLKDK